MGNGIESEHTFGLRLFHLIKEDYRTNGSDWTKPGFRALAVYRFGVWRMRIRSKLLRVPFSIAYRLLFSHVRNHYGIEIPHTAKIGRRLHIEHQNGIIIHGNASIGNDCYIRQGCTLGNKSLSNVNDAPDLGDHVNIGAGAKLLGKIKIGSGSSIGANAVVLIDVPEGSLALGIPATIKFPSKPATVS